MEFKAKAIILDMDGTMLDHKNEVSENLHAFIKQLRNRGEIIFIATGRTLEEIKENAPGDLEVDGIVSANGMAVYMENRQIAKHTLKPELVQELVQKAGRENIYYEVHPDEGRRMALKRDESYFRKMITPPYPETVKVDEQSEREVALDGNISWKENIQTENIAKVYFFSKDKKSMVNWKSELDTLKEKVNFSAYSSSDHNVEVMAENISKATGIQYLLDRFDIKSEQVMMIGDSENDLPLMEIAGYSVAMQNAPDRVKEKVDEITEYDNKEDGLYKFLIKNFGN